MIRKLRMKFVAVCMLLVVVFLSALFGLVYFSVEHSVEALSRQVLYRVIQEESSGDGIRRPDIGITIGGDRVLLPYFTVELWGSNAYITGGTYANLEDTQALAGILSACLAREEPEGVLTSYHMRYLRQDNGLYQTMAFVDISMETSVLGRLFRSYLLIAAAAALVFLGVCILLARPLLRQ